MAIPDNGKNLITSLNPSLLYLLINSLQDEIITVSKTGSGDFTTIADAINSGAKQIFVKNGTYAETEDLILDGVVLIGESPKNCIIQLGDYSIELKTMTAADSYATGTCTFTNNSTTVTGIATVWDTGGSAPSTFADPWIISEGFCFKISSFSSDTGATISTQYRGTTFTGKYVIVDAANIGSRFSNFQIQHSPSGAKNCLKVSGIGNIIDNNIFLCDRSNTDYVIKMSPLSSYNIGTKIYNNNIISGAIAIEMRNAQSCLIENNIINSPNDHAIITLTNAHDCLYNTITKNKIFGCTNTAIELDTGSDYTEISYNNISKSRSSGITADDCDHLNITNNIIQGNSNPSIITTTLSRYLNISNNELLSTGMELSCRNAKVNNNHVYGSIELTGDESLITCNTIPTGRILSAGNDNIVNSNHLTSSLADEGIHLNGAYNTCVGNQFDAANGYGIVCDGTGGHSVSGNTIANAEDSSIRINAPDCCVTGNTIINYSNSGGYGIHCLTTAVRSQITGNIIRNALGSAHGIYVNSDKISISSNKITETNGGNGIHFNADAQGPNGECIISNNHLETIAIGINCHTSDGAVNINSNIIKSTSSHGIYKTGNGNNISINNNTIHNSLGLGIYIDSNGKNSTITNNNIDTCAGNGIYFNTGTADIYTSICANTIKDVSHGIYLDSEGGTGIVNNNCTISSNTIFNATLNGLNITTSNNVISANICFYCDNGISNATGDRNIINANNCQYNSSYGINITNTSDRIIITDNITLNNTTGQLLNNGTNTIAANNITV